MDRHSIYAAPRTFFCGDVLAALTGAAALTLAAASGRFVLAIGLYVAVMTGGNAYSIGFMPKGAASG